MAITAQCGSCNKKFKANEQLAGKRVKCPQCGGVITIPVPQPAESHGSMASLLDEESVPATPAPKPKPKAPAAIAKKCPSCSAEITAGAVLCVNCGFDLRTGKPVEIGGADAAADGAKKKKKKKKHRGDTPQSLMFLRGCAVSLGFALLGSLAWWALAYFTGFESGYIALMIGALAGGGMKTGYGVEDVLAGLAAAAVAIMAIFIAKVFVFAVLLSQFQEDFADAMVEDAEFQEMMEEESADQGMADGVMSEDDGGSASEDSGNEQEVPSVKGEEEFPDEFSEDFEEPPEVSDTVVNAVTGLFIFLAAAISMVWPPLNILFLGLAAYVAYQVGSG